MSTTAFRFKEFSISQEQCAMKINTDGVLLGAWVDVKGKHRVLDVGTGTGVIAIMIAQRSHADKIIGVEIDEDSQKECKINMSDSKWSERLEVHHQSIQDFSNVSLDKFDLIVSNPPFFSGGTFSSTQKRTLVKHTVKLPHGELLLAVNKLLSKQGDFSVILPYIEGLRFIELADQYSLKCNRIWEVRSFENAPIERLLISFGKSSKNVEKGSVYIRNEDNTFSEPYVNLTKEFYLKM